MTFQNHLAIDAGIGQIPGAPVEVNREAFRALFAVGDDGDTRRQRLHEVVQTQRMEFQALDMEIGFYYNDSAAVVPDGTKPPERDVMGGRYVPTTRPGHRLPHAWLTHGRETVSTLDLVGRGRFTLIAGADQADLGDFAAELGKSFGVAVTSVAIGPDASYQDKTGHWAEISGIGAGGAVLVRPDGHVAWRHAGDGDAAVRESLETAFCRILGRKPALVAAE